MATDREVVKGNCMTCGTEISPNAIGYCRNCADVYYKQRDIDFPYIVYMGNGDHEEFATEAEAEKFCDQMKSSYVETKNKIYGNRSFKT